MKKVDLTVLTLKKLLLTFDQKIKAKKTHYYIKTCLGHWHKKDNVSLFEEKEE
ncbi:MAG: hypothetical protein QY321_02855 [Patescibacteria group bacterium]|nr:MAG: hypothetical protein QY321_02855 [Patescibacteria group bacterium]